MPFWKELWSGDNSKVNTAAVIALILATPVIALSSAAVIYHVFLLKKGLDGPVVNLLLGMLGAATGGVGAMGVSMFSKTTMMSYMGSGIAQAEEPPPTRLKAAKVKI